MADPQLSLKRLEVFCLVVELGGVTRAAEQLRVAQPAVSAQIRSLEEWFGAPLFLRNAGRLRPTEAGASAYRWAKETLARSIGIRRFTQELALGGAGRLVVVASLALGTYLVPPILSRLRLERPGADITVHTSEPERAIQLLENGEADFAVVTWYEHTLPTTLRLEQLRAEPIKLVAGVDNASVPASISREQLGALPFVGIPTDVAMSRSLDTQLREAGVGPLNVVIRLGHAESIKEAIFEHGWVSLMPVYTTAREVALERMRHVHVEGLSLTEQLVLLTHRDVPLSPLQRVAYEAIRSGLSPGSSSP